MKNKNREGLKLAYRIIALVVAIIMIIGILYGSFNY